MILQFEHIISSGNSLVVEGSVYSYNNIFVICGMKTSRLIQKIKERVAANILTIYIKFLYLKKHPLKFFEWTSRVGSFDI